MYLAPQLGRRPVPMRVRASVMARLPFFKGLLFGDFSEASKVSMESPGIVLLPDDDAEALRLLARILHFDTNILPEILDKETLVEFAYLAHKYYCVGLVRGWSKIWVA